MVRDSIAHPTLLVFDLETVPDTSCVPQLLPVVPPDESEWEAALLAHYQDRQTGVAFLKPPFHRVVAISLLCLTLEADEQGQEQYAFSCLRSRASLDERNLLERFFAMLDCKQPRLVSWNGRGFDLPVLRYRAMRHLLPAQRLYQAGNRYSSYQHRYSEEWHCDLQDALNSYGAAKPARLQEACAVFGLPGKPEGLSGESVGSLFKAGDLDAICRYCETDVLNTYLVYLRHALHVGRVSLAGYSAALHNLREGLSEHCQDGKEAAHLQPFLDTLPQAQAAVASA